MLQFITIDSFALIDHLEIEFQSGFNLITGETGSGKSILVDAVGLLVGSRAQQEMIRQGRERARVEGSFKLTSDNPVYGLLHDSGYRFDDFKLLIRREITRSGSNRVFINGQLSTLGFLQQIGQYLADIHGQHTQQTLLNPQSHLEYLDLFGGNEKFLDVFRSEFTKLLKIRSTLSSLSQTEQEKLQRIDLLKFQISEIESLKLSPGLDLQLESERDLQATAERRAHFSGEAHQQLYEDENAVIPKLNQVEQHLQKLVEMDSNADSSLQKIREVLYLLEDIAFQVRDYSDSVQYDPIRLERLEDRLAEIDKIKRKYGSTVDEILEYLTKINTELEELNSNEENTDRLKSNLEKQIQLCNKKARELSEKRKIDSRNLSLVVENELSELSMKDTHFLVLLEEINEINEKGIDSGEFLFSANPGEDPRPLARIISGGELSRIMLALKSALKSEHYPATLIFDEVDSGIGGKTATVLGNKLSKLSSTHQVFCVTHLPQIAGFGKQHFHVDKILDSGRTIVTIQLLDQIGRVEELSRMLAGEAVTETTRAQAKQLIEGDMG